MPPFQPFYNLNFAQNPWRERPAQYFPFDPAQNWPGGWKQNGHVRRVKKPHYHFVWPKDKAAHGSKWGRFKDIVQGKGPDIHVTVSADKTDYMHNRQRRNRWANHLNMGNLGATTLNAKNDRNRKYDYYQRKYVKPYREMWTDAVWQGPNKDTMHPDQFRTLNGDWFMDMRWNGDPHF
ncbi:hypothetical protein CC80DRAFT_419657 [Byssothecium circinans]|uniref:Uncharacterized protein n=1 Tax=Byssothecium circinans TaxID=147558 RepID=A0A6A5TML4_9PLEO|nr:hypothetical protein CC80DRAFT_419657 [Byssothecium circinans]